MRFVALAGFVLLIAGPSEATGDALEQCARHFFQGQAPAFADQHENKDRAHFLCKDYGDHAFFSISYNHMRKGADWVAYRLGVDELGENGCRRKSRKDWRRFFGQCSINDEGRENCWDYLYPDQDLSGWDLQGLSKSGDYTNSGFNRGHQAPAAAFAWHGCGWFRTFTMANISPQTPNLNQGSWQALEQSVLNWAVSKGEVFVVTGPIYKDVRSQHPWLLKEENAQYRDSLVLPGATLAEGQASIPTASYKVVVDPAADRAIAFVIPNGYRDLPWREMAVKISLVESLTDLSFSLPENQRNADPHLLHWPNAETEMEITPCEDGASSVEPSEAMGIDGRSKCWH